MVVGKCCSVAAVVVLACAGYLYVALTLLVHAECSPSPHPPHYRCVYELTAPGLRTTTVWEGELDPERKTMEGIGVFTADAARYDGRYEGSIRSGRGKLELGDGTVMEGEFGGKRGLLHGSDGVFVSAWGSVAEAGFANGSMNGPARLALAQRGMDAAHVAYEGHMVNSLPGRADGGDGPAGMLLAADGVEYSVTRAATNGSAWSAAMHTPVITFDVGCETAFGVPGCLVSVDSARCANDQCAALREACTALMWLAGELDLANGRVLALMEPYPWAALFAETSGSGEL